MKRAIIFIFVCLNINLVSGQKNKIEFQPFLRYDSYPEFSYNLQGRVSTDLLSMKGVSWGFDLNYKYLLQKHLYLKAGIGYYKYTFNKLNNLNSVFGQGSARWVDYPDPNLVMNSTYNYWYNNLSANIGLERLYILNNDIQITTGVNWRHYFTYSKRYNINYDSNGSSYKVKYAVSEPRYFGNSLTFQFGISKPIGKFRIGPTIIIPIYDYWKKDQKFAENEREGRNKLLRGFGMSVTISHDL